MVGRGLSMVVGKTWPKVNISHGDGQGMVQGATMVRTVKYGGVIMVRRVYNMVTRKDGEGNFVN